MQIGEFRVPEQTGETWLFGVTSPMISTSYPVRPERYVWATLNQSGASPQQPEPFEPREAIESRYRAVSRTMHLRDRKLERPWVILRLPEKCEQMRGLYLPDHMKDRDDMAVVEAVSENCKHVRPGHVVWYQRRALEGLYSVGPDFGSLPEYAIFAILNV